VPKPNGYAFVRGMNRIPLGKQNERQRNYRATDGDDVLVALKAHFLSSM
jgi:hypothetical protein